jgi:hypothetical protein
MSALQDATDILRAYTRPKAQAEEPYGQFLDVQYWQPPHVPAGSPFLRLDASAVTLNLVKTFEQRLSENKHWARIVMELSGAPTIKVTISRLPNLVVFGSEVTDPGVVLRHYFSKVVVNRRKSINDVSRAMHTWRVSGRLDMFRSFFDDLHVLECSDIALSLMLTALTESYPLAEKLPERAQFRDWLKSQVAKTFSEERSNKIFSHLS